MCSCKGSGRFLTFLHVQGLYVYVDVYIYVYIYIYIDVYIWKHSNNLLDVFSVMSVLLC